ncbi:MAG: bifunctional UDP-N-acetylmuramoyl-tripeptide:D-alanyl-D-alanine ligase/alanine racemase [Bacteroidaceae bacterium]|nr:bifunctional UDP-N-acetylmuramoyl-tripeptide:D-alanyl-D-alanine ligase/alanine racemase [Bacteroidaceae bacterium]
MQYTIGEISKILNATLVGPSPDSKVTRLLTDSRSLSFPEETLFFAIVTLHGNGHAYIPELYSRGVRCFVVSSADAVEACPDANFILVKDTVAALQSLAARHRSLFDIPVVGITGSDGKTIVKEWLYHLTAGKYLVTRSPRSYNSQIGVPLSVWMLGEESTLGIFEAGISLPHEMERLQKIIRPTIGILTNISGAHQENFTTMQEKCSDKLSLFKDCDVLIYNGDNPMLVNCVARSMYGTRDIAWSQRDPERPLYISSIEKGTDSTTINYHYLSFENSYSIPFLDDASIEDSINCLAAALYLMIPPDVIAERMAQLEPVAMRLEVKEGRCGCMLINDSYNSDIASLDIALDFMERRCSTQPHLGRTLILGDIKQTGLTIRSLYRTVAQYVEKRGVDRIVGIGKDISSERARFDKLDIECYFFPDTDSFMRSPLLSSFSNEAILIKGSRSLHFEQIAEALEEKVHQTILEVNLSSLRDNLNRYRNKLAPGTKTVCMVKASAYGAGALEVGRTLQECKVDYLAVAVADEGAELRSEGITTGIIVMNPEPSSFRTLFANKLEPEVYSFGMLRMLVQAAGREGITDYPIHIKIDTGMHRLGFLPDEIPQLIEELKHQDALTPRSVFSHFVGSDSAEFDDFTRQQVSRFEGASQMLQDAFPHRILRHICNSAGAERFLDVQYDMVRLGIGLYGISPMGEDATLHPISTLKTIILQIHDIPADETVGYSRRGKLTRSSRIAALPIGYADGLNRKFGNGNGYCIINGKQARYIGNICMDVCMVDVTDIDCKEGDEVEIFGKNLPVLHLARWIDTIPYEILTSISTRIKRVYYSD